LTVSNIHDTLYQSLLRGGFMKRKLKILIAILGILVVVLLGVFFFIKGPDMGPLSSYFTWLPSWDEFKEKVSFLHAGYETPPTISAQVQQAANEDRIKYEAIIQKNDKREEQIKNQLKAAGVTVGGAYIVDTDKGQQMLALSFPFTPGILSSNNFINSLADSMVKIADLKILDLTGLVYVNTFLTDSQDRVICGVTARTSDIQNYRAGKLTLEQFFSKTAIGVESRSAALDAISGGLKK
jgi:hypothetical protein